LYSTQAGQRIEAASTIKIPIAMLFFKSVEVVGTPSLEGYLAEKGIDGRTYQQLLHAMLVVSEEDATDSLVKAIRESRLDVKATLNEWGAAHTDIFLRKTTVEDIAALIDGFYAGERLLPPARQIMLNYMAEYTSADNTRIGVIRGRLPCWGTIYNKRGTITTPYLAVADVAIVEFPSAAGERAYTIALFAYPGKSGNTYESLVQGMETLAPVFWQAIRVENGLPESGCGKP
jgi:beta-lactamase class A